MALFGFMALLPRFCINAGGFVSPCPLCTCHCARDPCPRLHVHCWKDAKASAAASSSRPTHHSAFQAWGVKRGAVGVQHPQLSASDAQMCQLSTP